MSQGWAGYVPQSATAKASRSVASHSVTAAISQTAEAGWGDGDTRDNCARSAAIAIATPAITGATVSAVEAATVNKLRLT
jgi:hypothetical protein